jgi:hypothetical protein
LPGIGKTVLARAVGRELGWPVLDEDGDAAEHRRRIETRTADSARAGWTTGDWSAFIEYRDRTASNADYSLDVPHFVVDLGLPVADAAQLAATWLRTLGQLTAT